jgi:transcriptional regulator with XRE-family HTH domain
MNYGRGLRIARAAKGLSQKELAEMTGLNGNYISMIEAGRRVPSADTLKSLADAMVIPVYLLSLLSSDPEDLKGISPEHAEILGKELLALVIGEREEQQ